MASIRQLISGAFDKGRPKQSSGRTPPPVPLHSKPSIPPLPPRQIAKLPPPPATTRIYQHLSDSQVASFLQHGFLRVENCFTREQAAEWTADVWARLGFDPCNKSTWVREWTLLPETRTVKVSEWAPKAWRAICEVCGGEDRVAEESNYWQDALIVNLGSEEWEGRTQEPNEVRGWHVDGNFFLHFLDSPEQALLVIPVLADIEKDAGGTMICSDGISRVAEWLHDHPQGVSPGMVPLGEESAYTGIDLFTQLMVGGTDFHEITGNVGDVILLHPLMMHSATRNSRRRLRIITNPRVALNSPFTFDRGDEDEYSLVELKTLRDLRKKSLRDWRIQGSRQWISPES